MAGSGSPFHRARASSGEARAGSISSSRCAAMDDVTRLELAWFGQRQYRCRLDWGGRGAAAAAARGDLLVVVDTLTFSTAVASALHCGAVVFPCLPSDEERVAKEVGAEAAVKRQDVPRRGRFSLSPETLLAAGPGARVALGSPNGAACCLLGRDAPAVVVASLVNARAVARFVSSRLAKGNQAVTLLACGERWA